MPDSPDGPSERLGLCSVTLRDLPAAEVVRVAASAGLRRIEWGADVHAPADDPATLADVRELTSAAGLTTCSYGSYWRAGDDPQGDLVAAVRAASALGCHRIRIWAGSCSPADAGSHDWDRVVRAVHEAAEVASDHATELAFEFHRGTLTETVDSTLHLLARVDRPEVTTYWQPPLDAPVDAALDGLRRLLPKVSCVHAFSWWPFDHRLPLAARADLWTGVIDLLRQTGARPDVLLEFVPSDDPECVVTDAATLQHWSAALA